MEYKKSHRLYEYNNHLSNVLTVSTDKKVFVDSTQSYAINIISATDYYPFGLAMYGRENKSEKYRFGFNGKENDQEWGDQLIQDYGFRIYNPSIGKFLSTDPLTRNYPMLTPYQFASNSPIAGIDLDGLEFYFAADGTFIGRYGKGTQIRIVRKIHLEYAREEMARKYEIGYYDPGPTETLKSFFVSESLRSAREEIVERVLKTIYERESIGDRSYTLIDIDYVDGRGVSEYKDDEGNPLSVENARAYYSKKTKKGLILLNTIESGYFDVASTLFHENLHNQKSALGIESAQGYEHFLVEKGAYERFKHKVTESSYANTVWLLKSYRTEHEYLLHKIKEEKGADSKEYREEYKKYEEMTKYLKEIIEEHDEE